MLKSVTFWPQKITFRRFNEIHIFTGHQYYPFVNMEKTPKIHQKSKSDSIKNKRPPLPAW